MTTLHHFTCVPQIFAVVKYSYIQSIVLTHHLFETKFYLQCGMFLKTANSLMYVRHFSFIYTEMTLNPRDYKNVLLCDASEAYKCVK